MKKAVMIVVAFAIAITESWSEERRDYLSVKTNLAYDALTAVNLGIGIPLWSGHTLEVTCVFPDWVDRKTNRYALQIELFGAEFRKYIHNHTFGGLYCGIGAQYGRACIQCKSDDGLRINDFRSMGVTVGYLQRFAGNLAIEYGIGLGYVDMKYDRYRIEEYQGQQYLSSCGSWRYDYSIWPVPTVISVSLTYLFGGVRYE